MEIKLFKPHEGQKEVIDTILSPSIFFVIAVIGRQWGKSTLGQNLAVYWALNDPHSIIYWVSPTDTQAQKVYKSIINAIIESGCVNSKKASKGETEIIFTNGSVIKFKSAHSEDNLRGESVDYLILDEAAFMKQDTVEGILLPMLSVRGKKCVILTTPKGKNYIHNYYKKGKEKDNWASFRYSTYDSPYASKEIIKMFKETLAPTLYKQEVEAEFVDNASVFENIQDILVLDRLENPLPNKKYFAGIDIGLKDDATVISIVDESGNLVNFIKLEKYTSPKIVSKILEINQLWKFKKVYIENNNQGLPIYQELEGKMNNIEEFNTNTKTKPEIINRLIHLFNMKQIKCVNDEDLRLELEAFIFKQSTTGTIKFQADNGFHDDIIMSLAIAIRCKDGNLNKGNFDFFVI